MDDDKKARVELAIVYYDDDNKSIALKEYRRLGRLQVCEQFTSYARECALDFWKIMEKVK